MVPSGPPTPVGGAAQPVPPSLLRSNSASALLGGAQSASPQQPFSSIVSPRGQFGGGSTMLGNNVSSLLLNHSFGNGEQDPLSFASTSGQQAQDRTPQQLNGTPQGFHQQYQQLRGGYGNGGGLGPVKLEQQTGSGDQSSGVPPLSMCSIGTVKLEPQQLPSARSLGPVKLERQLSDSSMFLQQQQQQQYLQMTRQSSQATAAHINMLHQQRMIQLQQQQQILSLPQQRIQLRQQVQQGLPVRPQGKAMMYEPGMCARRLTHYMYHQQHRPEDNNIEFWRKFVPEYFAPNAKKRWCVSLYGSGRQTTGVFPQDVWHCEICNRKPGRSFETTIEVLPRLFQIKYASGTLEELLYVDMPREYQNASGQIVLDYAKAIQESVFEQLRVVREGQLRIVFSPELKICSWEFCARRHEELIPRRLLIPQVSQLGAVVQKYQTAAQNASSGLSAQDLQNNCNSFVASARQLAKALEVPLVNDLGYTKRYVRCLQISEVVNSMKDLIDYSRETGTGPMDSLINFPRRISGPTGPGQQTQQPEQQQTIAQNQSRNGQSIVHVPGMQIASASTGVTSVNSSLNIPSTTSMSAPTIVGLLHQNSMNSRQENLMSSANSPYGGLNTVKIPSASSSNSLPPSQPNPSSPYLSPTPSTSNNIATPVSLASTNLNTANLPTNMPAIQQQTPPLHETDPIDSDSSVQQILQEMMMSSQVNGVSSLGNSMKGNSGVTPAMNGGNILVGNGIGNGSGVAGMRFGGMGAIGSSTTANGLRAAMSNNAMAMNGRVGMNHIPQDPMTMNHQQQQDAGNRLLNGLGSTNSFNNLQFDWKSSP